MLRRDFLHLAGVNSLAAILGNNALARERLGSIRDRERITAGELNGYLRSLHPVREPSCDRIIVGNPKAPVHKVALAWMGYQRTCAKALEAGAQALIVHEPIFYSHWDLQARTPRYQRFKASKAAYEKTIADKRKWLRKNGLNVIRCHDVLDRVAGFGIPFALGRALGFPPEDILRRRPCYHVYKVKPRPAEEMARHIANRLEPYRQPGVAFYGDPQRTVASVGVGTGCICDPMQYADIAPDLYIAIDDKVTTWIQTCFAEDSGHPLVVINHGTSEEPGMKALTGHLAAALPKLEFIHLGDGCGYRWVAPQ